MKSTFIDREKFHAAAIAIAALAPCPFYGRVTTDQVKVALGQHADVWPDSIEADCDEDSDKES